MDLSVAGTLSNQETNHVEFNADDDNVLIQTHSSVTVLEACLCMFGRCGGGRS